MAEQRKEQSGMEDMRNGAGDETASLVQGTPMAILRCKPVLASVLQTCCREFQDVPLDTIVRECLPGSGASGQPPETLGGIEMVPRWDGGLPMVSGEKGEDLNADSFQCLAYTTEEHRRTLGIRIDVVSEDGDQPFPVQRYGMAYCSAMLARDWARFEQKRRAGDQVGSQAAAASDPCIDKVYSIWIIDTPRKEAQGQIVQYAWKREVLAGNPADEPRENWDCWEVVAVYLKEQLNEQEEQGAMVDLLHLLNKGRNG